MRVADRARLLVELHEIRKKLAEAGQRVDRLSASVKADRRGALRGDQAAS